MYGKHCAQVLEHAIAFFQLGFEQELIDDYGGVIFVRAGAWLPPAAGAPSGFRRRLPIAKRQRTVSRWLKVS
jgi:hypothetical protein